MEKISSIKGEIHPNVISFNGGSVNIEFNAFIANFSKLKSSFTVDLLYLSY